MIIKLKNLGTKRKEKVLNKLIKNGNNTIQSKKYIDKYFNDAVRIYGKDTSVKDLADIIKSFAVADAGSYYGRHY